MLITISGLDGAGKTTLAHCLRARLEPQNRRVVVLHMYYQMGTYAFLRALRSWIVGSPRRTNGSPKENWVSFTHNEFGRPQRLKIMIHRLAKTIIWNKSVRRCVYLLDLIIFLIYRLKIEMIKKQVLIMDRYFYDKLVDLSDDRGFYNRFLAMLTPTPTLPIYLDITPQEADARKREQSLKYLTRRWVAYHNIFPQLPGSVVLAGNNDLNANVSNLERIVRERMDTDGSRTEKFIRCLNSALASQRFF
jgi:thymidylate kinase